MTTSPTPTRGVPPWALATAAMFSIQLSSALAVPLIASVGAAGTAWLRLTAAPSSSSSSRGRHCGRSAAATCPPCSASVSPAV